FDAQLAEVQRQTVPMLFAFLARGEIELGHQLLGALQGDRVAVFVIALDDLLLELRILCHEVPSVDIKMTKDQWWAQPTLLVDRRFGPCCELGESFFTEKRFRGFDKITLSEEALGVVIAGLHDNRQWLFGFGSDQISNSLFSALGSHRFGKWYRLEHLIHGV